MSNREETAMQATSACNSEAENSSLATPPITPAKGKLTTDARTEEVVAELPKEEELLYIKLKPEYTEGLTWSNDPRDLDLQGIFSQDKPNLSSGFNVEGLRPILKEEDGEDPWILRDAQGSCYLWDMWDGHLLKVTDNWTTGPELKDIEDVMKNILANLSWVEEEAVRVFRTYD
ncbi:hypothetical protein CC86DRAFT_399909 [Ophiobolus disseminans]|uniref:Uncharacterized protein n=1 Tax=Ophiobolus disseminans TaxID=1469910 RepID=A0A6A7AKM0_9PLEO|nr:hypothetical protein CC86DRAFT_399909 [Ophiobolus disseminans]